MNRLNRATEQTKQKKVTNVSQQLKIGFFTDSYFPQINGVTYTIKLWKESLEARGHQVLLAYPQGNYKPEADEHPLPAIDFPFYEGYRIGLPNHLSLPDTFDGLDLVHIHSFFSLGIVGAYLAHRDNLPLVASFHTPIEDYIDYVTEKRALKNLIGKGYGWWERYLLNRCQLVTAPSLSAVERVETKLSVENRQKKPKTARVPNGIDTDFFSPCDPAQFKQDYRITADNVIGFTGRHCLGKNLEDLIKIADWYQENYNGEIVIAGQGPETEKYEDLSENKANVKLLPFFERKELPYFYSCLDFFVFPSTIETEGLVALEANACGTPVIAAEAGGLQDKIKAKKNGYLFSPRDTDHLKQKLEVGYKQLERNKRLKEQSRKVALTDSVDSSVDQIEREYGRLL